MSLYKPEDFHSGDGAGNRAIADRANALHDERCPAAKENEKIAAEARYQDMRCKAYNEQFLKDKEEKAQRDAEIERLRAAYSDATDQQERLNAMLTDARADNARLREALEQERVRLAACGVAALGYVKGENKVKEGDYAWSASYGDVLKLLKREQLTEHMGNKLVEKCQAMRSVIETGLALVKGYVKDADSPWIPWTMNAVIVLRGGK